MDIPATGHQSVLLEEVLNYLPAGGGSVIVDCTLGRGGHSAALAGRLGKGGLLIGLDVDPANLEFAKGRLAGLEISNAGPHPSPLPEYRERGQEEYRGRVRLFQANFAELGDVLKEVGIEKVDGILADLGVSTNQLFESNYGLSFAQEMPLDMRLDSRIRYSAADVVNKTREDDLANILFNLAQERYSRRIARKIVEARRISPITTTERLAELVRSAIPKRGGAPERIDPATRTFLALRMHVNQEMSNLQALLKHGPRLLNSKGRMAVISFQSMEDRLVKQAFRLAEQAGDVTVLTKKPVTPAEAELAANPRSRSAKMRVIEKK